MIYQDGYSLETRLRGVLKQLQDGTAYVAAASTFTGTLAKDLAETAVFSLKPEVRADARYYIKLAGRALGIKLASINDLYRAMGRGEIEPFTVPAVNVRGLTFDVARSLFKAALKKDCGAFIFEIARTEMGYTSQPPAEYVAVIMAAALREGFKGPLFIQGDHFQAGAAGYSASAEEEIEQLKIFIRKSVAAGFYNIDIDSSTLVHLEFDDLRKQQYDNAAVCAELTRFIRSMEPEGITVSVGGEIGEVGGHNSTLDEFTAFMSEYNEMLGDHQGISKISVQTGTSHGGVVLADGTVAEVNLDFDVLRSISDIARGRYGMGGTVQHGASTLPDDAFHNFPINGACEVHLATGFQNMIFDHPSMPEAFRDSVYEYLTNTYAGERKVDYSDAQFFYKTRKKGFGGRMKRDWWNLPKEVRRDFRSSLKRKFSFLFDELRVSGTKEIVERFTTAEPPLPDRQAELEAALHEEI